MERPEAAEEYQHDGESLYQDEIQTEASDM